MEYNNIALVTGGGGGIGESIVKLLAENGYKCLIAGRKINENIASMQKNYGAEFYVCDISIEQDRLALANNIYEKYGKIDLLINNAGVAPKVREDILSLSEEAFDFVVDINLKGTFFLTQTIANKMIVSGCGRIVNISSISAYTSSTMRGEYCISKAGISMITKLFADRLAQYGIGVFEIRPGIIDTEMTAKVKDKYQKLIDEGLTPIARMGKGEDVAKCVLAVANGYLDFGTGTVLNADGGFSIRRL